MVWFEAYKGNKSFGKFNPVHDDELVMLLPYTWYIVPAVGVYLWLVKLYIVFTINQDLFSL